MFRRHFTRNTIYFVLKNFEYLLYVNASCIRVIDRTRAAHYAFPEHFRYFAPNGCRYRAVVLLSAGNRMHSLWNLGDKHEAQPGLTSCGSCVVGTGLCAGVTADLSCMPWYGRGAGTSGVRESTSSVRIALRQIDHQARLT
jgi:hypothetical protein